MLWRAGCIACAGASFDCSDRLALGRTLFLAGGASCKEGLSIAAPFLASFGRSGPTPTAGRSRRSAPRRSGAPARTPGITYTYDANGNQITRDGASQAWASFNLPVQVAQPVGGTTYLSQFSYGPDRQRWKQVASYSNGTETTYYVGGLLEKESPSSGATQWRHYVHLPSGMAIVVARASNNQKTVRYLLVDHLGSTDKVLNEAGAIVASYSYGVYGNRRGSDWGGTAPDWSGIANSTRHGYTGHEHLDNVLLVHMNGRVYDPAIGRFMSADPIGIDAWRSQSWNRYAYVQNRPLRFTDPTGYTDDDAPVSKIQCKDCDFPVEMTVEALRPRDPGVQDRLNEAHFRNELAGILGRPSAGLPLSEDGTPEMVVTATRVPANTPRRDKPQGDGGQCMSAAARVIAAGIGVVELGAGTSLMVVGIVTAGASIFLAPTTGGGSLAGLPLGILNATLGAAAIADSVNMLQSAATGQSLQPSMFAQIGAQYGGSAGGQAGDAANLAGQVYSAAKNPPATAGQAVLLVITFALSSVLPESTADCKP